jgi:hypothetical protein
LAQIGAKLAFEKCSFSKLCGFLKSGEFAAGDDPLTGVAV